MDNLSWVTSWEKWREVYGPKRGRHRAAVDEFLKTHPAILYWGDSWFSTPLYLNLAKHSVRQVEGMGLIVGKPGAEAAELFTPGNVQRMVGRLRDSAFDVLCLSAGGNDCLDEHLAEVFAKWQGKRALEKISAQAAYAMLAKSNIFKHIFQAYDGLLSALVPIAKAKPTFRVIGHPYVPIELIGAKADLTTGNVGLIAWVKGDVGPWMWNRMQHVLADKDEGKTFAKLMLVDGFKVGVLGALVKKYSAFFSVADFDALIGEEQPGFWNDEIHPTQDGFLAISRLLNDEIRKKLPAAKQAAVH